MQGDILAQAARLLPPPRHRLATLLPSANIVVETLTQALLRPMPEVAALFTRIPKRGAGDPFPDSHDWSALEDAAALLADAKPDALIFNAGKGAAIGLAQDRELAARIWQKFGLPLTTPGLALIRALRVLNIQKIALAGPHKQSYNHSVSIGLAVEGIETVAEASLGLTDNLSYAGVDRAELAMMIRRVGRAKGVQAVVVWNTNCFAAPLAAGLEAELGIPVLDATALGVWDGLRLAGVGARLAPEWGRLFALEPEGKE